MVPRKYAVLALVTSSAIALGGCRASAEDATCEQCGEIQRIQSYVVDGKASPVGALAGAVIGGVVGHQIGGGRGKDAATAAGALGGAAAGAEIERRQNQSTRYEVLVELDTGSQRTVNLNDVSGWEVGDRVRLANGELLRAPS